MRPVGDRERELWSFPCESRRRFFLLQAELDLTISSAFLLPYSLLLSSQLYNNSPPHFYRSRSPTDPSPDATDPPPLYLRRSRFTVWGIAEATSYSQCTQATSSTGTGAVSMTAWKTTYKFTGGESRNSSGKERGRLVVLSTRFRLSLFLYCFLSGLFKYKLINFNLSQELGT